MSLSLGYPPQYKQARQREWDHLAMHWTSYSQRDSFHSSALTQLKLATFAHLARQAVDPVSLVDLGCGTGVFLQGLRDGLGQRWQELVGIDFCPRMLQLAIESDVSGTPRLQFIDADLEVSIPAKLPRLQGSFDVATAAFLLDEVEDVGTCFASAAQLLRRGGHLIACTLDYDRELQRHADQLSPDQDDARPIVISRPLFIKERGVIGQYFRILRTTEDLQRFASTHSFRPIDSKLLSPSDLGSRADGPSLRMLSWSLMNK